MTAIEEVDLAKIDPCPGCGVPIRRFRSVPIAGTNRDPITSPPWYCDLCIGIRTLAVTRDLEEPTVRYRLQTNLLGLLTW